MSAVSFAKGCRVPPPSATLLCFLAFFRFELGDGRAGVEARIDLFGSSAEGMRWANALVLPS